MPTFRLKWPRQYGATGCPAGEPGVPGYIPDGLFYHEPKITMTKRQAAQMLREHLIIHSREPQARFINVALEMGIDALEEISPFYDPSRFDNIIEDKGD